ncbi:uncharacterized protein LOC116345734 [Contarinia nasturtii]|uniref:uncharacterized protein LOC116345734 n=1 Tax=Contarinia nasturtii TaxID=265458 RepID=UPI0012D398F7|nr:uncharacterized protein LOC116345734 [Contarinia nasturtii]XP_031631242.1 uncharacterized protein LOC116345734 [Contarinia nasturtii]
MSARLIILLTVAFVMILNAHVVVAHPLTPSEQMLLDFESAQLAKKLAFQLQHSVEEKYQPYGGHIEQMPPSGYIENYEKPVDNINDINNNLNEPFKSAEQSPAEPLPNAERLVADDKTIMYKKNGKNYHMTICHFKICNMGRKRDTHNQMY